jgi:hypothetical protein
MSYDCRDKNLVQLFEAELSAKGVTTVLGCKHAKPGYRLDLEINRLIHSSDFVCVIITTRSARNPNVTSEYTHAIDTGKRVIAIVQDKAKLSYIIHPKRWISLDPKNPEIAAKELANSILHEVGVHIKAKSVILEVMPLIACGIVTIVYPWLGIPLEIENVISAIVNFAKTKVT